MDDSFSSVKSVRAGGGMAAADLHEFNVINKGKSALMTVFRPLPYDLTSFNVSNGQGFIMENIMQEVDTKSSEVLFEWSALNHVDPSAGYVLPNTTDVSGDGKTPSTPWDYL